MAKVVRGLKSGFFNIVGALKCGGRPTTAEPPMSPTPAKNNEVVYVGEAQKHRSVVHIGEARQDLYVGAAEFESVQVMRMVRTREPAGAPRGSRPRTG